MNNFTNAIRKNKALFIIGTLFFIFGFVTWLNGTLIPFLRIACELKTDTQAFLVTFSFYIAYFFLAIPSSYILKRTGFKKGMAWGLIVMAIGSFIFIPAAISRNFYLFLAGLFMQGGGLALLQTASNPYISILGPIESAARRMSIMGISNKFAGVLSPLLLSTIVLKNAGPLEARINNATDPIQKELLLSELAGRVIYPYLAMAIVLLLLSLFIYLSSLPEIDVEGNGEGAVAAQEETKGNIFQFPHLLLGVLCLFFAVGVEVLAGDAIGLYGQSMGITLDVTKYFTAFTLIAMLLGYIAGIFLIPKVVSQQKALMFAAVTGVFISIAIYSTSGYTAIFFIALLGFANAIMWPAIFPLAIKGIGKFTKTGSALLIMGIAGGAVLPLLYGTLKAKPAIGNSMAFFICMIPSYLFILYYATIGYRKVKPVRQLRQVLQ